MTIYEFHLITHTEKVELLYKHGVYIGKQKEANQIKVLYQLDSFYVEIFYKKYRRLIHYLRYFTNTESLNPYLSQIDVEEIMRYVE